MAQHLRYRLSNAEKDALLSDQAVLIDALAARIRELEAKLLSPKKTSKNSHTPPSAGHKANAKSGPSAKKRPRPSRPGASRKLAESPDEIRRQRSTSCGGCGTDVSGQRQHIRHRYDHIDLPPIAPHTTRVELLADAALGAARGSVRLRLTAWRRARRSGRTSTHCFCICIIVTMSGSSG